MIFKLFKIFILASICVHLVVGLSLHKHSLRSENHFAYKDNLQAQNWYYGGITSNEYRLRIFKIAANEAVAVCPITAPVMTADMAHCESCTINAPLRNLATSTC